MNNKNPIFLSSWSIRDQIESKKLSLNQFFEFARQNGFQGAEIVDRHLKSLEENYIKSLVRSVKKSGIAINLAISNDFAVERPKSLQMQINYVLNMIRLAEELEVKIIRIYLGGYDNRFEKLLKKILTHKNDSTARQSIKLQKSVISNFLRFKFFKLMHVYMRTHQKPKPLTNGKVKDRILRAIDSVLPLAEKCSIDLAIENHWGVSTLSENILQIINHYQSPYLGICPDFGNFTIHQDKYEELANLLPFAKEVHAKSYQFTPVGEEKEIDYARCINLMKAINFEGPITVEYEGDGEQVEGSLATRDLIWKYF